MGTYNFEEKTNRDCAMVPDKHFIVYFYCGAKRLTQILRENIKVKSSYIQFLIHKVLDFRKITTEGHCYLCDIDKNI